MNAEILIELLNLEPLPIEGGFFRRTYLADESLTGWPERYHNPKAISSAIYYLLRATDFSAFHRLATDEVYHFYLGDPVELVQLVSEGDGAIVILGQTLTAGQRVQTVVSRGVWQGSRLKAGGQWALLGTTLAPAYADSDFELGNRESLMKDYPDWIEYIQALTR